MSDIYLCRLCGGTYFLWDEPAVCNACRTHLVQMCEWCELPEKECRCGKDEISLE